MFVQLAGAYSVSKTALLGLCKAMAKTCAAKNIRVNAIAPGIIKTKFSEAVSTVLNVILYYDWHRCS